MFFLLEQSQLIGLREDYAAYRYDVERFDRRMQAAPKKFDVIAEYCREDLFAGINDPVASSSSQSAAGAKK